MRIPHFGAGASLKVGAQGRQHFYPAPGSPCRDWTRRVRHEEHEPTLSEHTAPQLEQVII